MVTENCCGTNERGYFKKINIKIVIQKYIN